MTPEQIKEFQQAIGTASWKLNLDRFAAAIGHNSEYDYTREKFLQFQQAAKALAQFDADTLAKIITAAE